MKSHAEKCGADHTYYKSGYRVSLNHWPEYNLNALEELGTIRKIFFMGFRFFGLFECNFCNFPYDSGLLI